MSNDVVQISTTLCLNIFRINVSTKTIHTAFYIVLLSRHLCFSVDIGRRKRNFPSGDITCSFLLSLSRTFFQYFCSKSALSTLKVFEDVHLFFKHTFLFCLLYLFYFTSQSRWIFPLQEPLKISIEETQCCYLTCLGMKCRPTSPGGCSFVWRRSYSLCTLLI